VAPDTRHPDKLDRAVIFLGLRARGKARRLASWQKKYGVPHLSTGDMLREHVAKARRLERSQADHGARELVPDRWCCRWFASELNGRLFAWFVFDGFPRTWPRRNIWQL